jgi:type III secretion system FlhB-like substrate exporter
MILKNRKLGEILSPVGLYKGMPTQLYKAAADTLMPIRKINGRL